MFRIPVSTMRGQLVTSIVLLASLATVVVAALSFYFGRNWALRDVDQRIDAIQQTLVDSSFPLTESVILPLANLTKTEMISVSEDGRAAYSTLQTPVVSEIDLLQLPRADQHVPPVAVRLGDRSFLAIQVARLAGEDGSTDRVAVLFDESLVTDMGRSAALLPLATGLSTVVLLSAAALLMVRRWVDRLRKLQQQAASVANGQFGVTIGDHSNDEIGRLGGSLVEMANQLQQLWSSVNRQQSTKVLHQISGGIAHQLRNSLTGCKLALQLHQKQIGDPSEELQVALKEVQAAEEHVNQLLLVGQGKRATPEPTTLLACLNHVESTVAPFAKHLDKQLEIQYPEEASCFGVQDGASLSAALSNLVLNGLQAGNHVDVRLVIHESPPQEPTAQSHPQSWAHPQTWVACFKIVDDGPGIEASVAKDLFEPFVTTKPEGIGLGLPVVQQAAEQLEGQVDWRRADERTSFMLECPVIRAEHLDRVSHHGQ